jgi:hypothetical protein
MRWEEGVAWRREEEFFIKLWFEILRITGHVKRVPGQRIPKLTMEWIPLERRKRGRPRKTRIEGGMTTRNLEPNQWRNREEWRLVSGRRRQVL